MDIQFKLNKEASRIAKSVSSIFDAYELINKQAFDFIECKTGYYDLLHTSFNTLRKLACKIILTNSVWNQPYVFIYGDYTFSDLNHVRSSRLWAILFYNYGLYTKNIIPYKQSIAIKNMIKVLVNRSYQKEAKSFTNFQNHLIQHYKEIVS